MQNIKEKDRSGGLLSIGKNAEDEQKAESLRNIDEVKILEISNFIDKWEETVLFSQNGFYSFTGKEAENKSREFIEELEKLINTKTDEEKFSDEYAKQIALDIKNKKIKAIADKMSVYEQQELMNWQKGVYSEAIASSVNRAVLYKNDPEIVVNSLNNGLTVISSLAEQEKWNKKTFDQKVKDYKSEFFYSLVKAFMSEKDINACKYYQRYSEYIDTEDKDKLEQAIYKLKVNIIAYNWAKEVFSYKLSASELDAEIKKIKDKDIEKEVKQYLKELSESEEKEKLQKEIQAEEKNWQEIISLNNSDNVGLYIDYTLSEQHINAVKYYIEQFRKNGFIQTDKTKYMNLMSEMVLDFAQFKQKDITFYRAYFSDEDFNFFSDCQKMQFPEFENLYYDCNFVKNKIEMLNIESDEDRYDFVKTLLTAYKDFKTKNKRNPDLQEKNKLIDSATERFKDKKEDKNDGTSDKSGK